MAESPLTRPLRLGFVGVGERGSYHLDLCLGMDGVEIPAICDTDSAHLYRAKRWIEEAGKPAPALYDRGERDYVRLCERSDLDIVVTATPWQYHAPVCLAALRAGKHAVTEVPLALTVEDCLELVEASESSGKHCVMLEQDNYERDNLLVLSMARHGLFGDLFHATGGYVHDLRLVMFDPEREPWRLQHSIDRNGNLYPTHPIGPIAWWLDINRGDSFEYLVSSSSRSGCLNEYAAHYFGKRHPYATMHMEQGDVNTTLIRTAKGRTIVLYFDTHTPHPHTQELRLQGTRGIFTGNTRQATVSDGGATLQGTSLDHWQAEHEHPLWRGLDSLRYKTARGHGGGVTTHLLWNRLLAAIRSGARPDMDVYDAAAWSVLSPISERSTAAGGRPQPIPDFTHGRWKSTPPVELS